MDVDTSETYIMFSVSVNSREGRVLYERAWAESSLYIPEPVDLTLFEVSVSKNSITYSRLNLSPKSLNLRYSGYYRWLSNIKEPI